MTNGEIADVLFEDDDDTLGDLSLCPECHCMTYTIEDGICGKCKYRKEQSR